MKLLIFLPAFLEAV